MENFTFLSPTKIIFGKDTELTVGEEIKSLLSQEYVPAGAIHPSSLTLRRTGKSPLRFKILLHYGGGSIKKTGLYNKIKKSLKEQGISAIELPGVKPNPRVSLIREGIKLCRKEKINFILAVGGGSVIDSAKTIAIGVPYKNDVWDFFTRKAEIKKTLPVGVVLTIPAAGSEASNSSVITNEDGFYKWGINSDLIRPKFAILNPEISYTLPTYQTSCGISDILAHLIERYFSPVENVDLTDRLIEGTFKSVIDNALIIKKNPKNYAARAEIMWASTLAHNGLLNTGRNIGDWASHRIEHELSAIYDIAHGAGLAIIIPAWMKYVYKENPKKFTQFAKRIWDIKEKSPIKATLKGIDKLENFYKKLNLPTSLSQAKIPEDCIQEMAKKCVQRGPVGQFKVLEKDDVLEILKLAK